MKIIIILTTFILCGCYTSKKADKDVEKAYINYKKQTLEKLRSYAPCIDKNIISDSSKYLNSIDSIVKILNYYDSVFENTPQEEILHDTVKIKDSVIYCLDKIKYEKYKFENLKLKKHLYEKDSIIKFLKSNIKNIKPIEITKTIEDDALKKINEELIKENKDLIKQNSNKKTFIILLLIPLAISIIINILKLKK